MNLKLGYLLVALSAFLIGAGLAEIGRLRSNRVTDYAPIVVTLCGLNANPKRYDRKLVTIKARLYSDVGGPYFYEPNCTKEWPLPLLDLNFFRIMDKDLDNWARKIGELGRPEEELEVDVTIVGLYDANYYDKESDARDVHRTRIIPISLVKNSTFMARH